MTELIDYIDKHTLRGECQCGKCIDKGPEREAPAHSVNVGFFWVSLRNEPSRLRLCELITAHYPDLGRFCEGLGYIELGAEIGSQDLALRLMGMGALLGVWKVVTPESLGIVGEEGKRLAGAGMVVCEGVRL